MLWLTVKNCWYHRISDATDECCINRCRYNRVRFLIFVDIIFEVLRVMKTHTVCSELCQCMF